MTGRSRSTRSPAARPSTSRSPLPGGPRNDDLHASRHDHDHGAAGGGARLRRLPQDGRRLGAPALLPVVRLRRLLRLVAEQARVEALRRERALADPLIGAGRGVGLVLRGPDRDAHPADPRPDAHPPIAAARRLKGIAMGNFISRGFGGGRARDREEYGDRIPPGQYLERGFPVLTAGPTPRIA